MDLLQTVLLVCVFVATVVIALEVRSWLSGVRQVTKRQKVYRIMAAALLEAVLLLIFFWKNVSKMGDPLLEIWYGCITFALGFGLLLIALLDVRETLAIYTKRQIDAYRDLLGEEIDKK